MRRALLSDIHGNLIALEAVLADVERAAVDRIVCLGDVAATGTQPRDCLQRVEALGCPVVMGNTDERFAHPDQKSDDTTESDDEEWQRFLEIDAWCRAQIGKDEQRFAQSFQPTVALQLGDGLTFLGYHGSPRSNREIIRLSTDDETLTELLEGASASVMAGGHTHRVMLRKLGGSLLVNPGSVGMPYEQFADGTLRHPPYAEWAIVSVNAGQINVDFRRTAIDRAAIIAAAFDRGMPHAEWWAKEWRV